MSSKNCFPIWRPRHKRITRRNVISSLGALTVLPPLEALAQNRQQCEMTIDSGEGPFYFNPELTRSEISEGHAGAPLSVQIEVMSSDQCAVLENARVDIWHANALGLYSGYVDQPGVGEDISTDARGESFLRGTQITDADGIVRFETIYPSWYGGRTPHLHFKVFLSDREVIAGQIFLPDATNQEVFSSWEPYRQYFDRRTGFNDRDMFFVAGVLQGATAETRRISGGYSAEATITVAT